MENAAAILCAPTSVSVTVRRPARSREYLTEREIEKLIKAAGEILCSTRALPVLTRSCLSRLSRL
jgi:hypothetical protein